MDLVLLSIEKYLEMEMCMIFQWITILLITLTLINVHKYLMTKNNIK